MEINVLESNDRKHFDVDFGGYHLNINNTVSNQSRSFLRYKITAEFASSIKNTHLKRTHLISLYFPSLILALKRGTSGQFPEQQFGATSVNVANRLMCLPQGTFLDLSLPFAFFSSSFLSLVTVRLFVFVSFTISSFFLNFLFLSQLQYIIKSNIMQPQIQILEE